jgi:hypothetical protein
MKTCKNTRSPLLVASGGCYSHELRKAKQATTACPLAILNHKKTVELAFNLT